MNELKERTDGLINIKSFSICGCPIKVIQEFKDFCVTETKNDYSMGLKILLERNRTNAQQEIMAMRLQEFEYRLGKMEEKPEQEETKKTKTFGGKKEDGRHKKTDGKE